MTGGWIKISRDIQSHWIYQDSEKLKWWIDLLLLANYEEKEFVIKFKVFHCKRGQLLYSLKSLSQRWNVSKSVVNNFLELLRKQNMIETQNETVTTRITICNYDTYQQNENANETQTKRKRNANKTECDTTKEYKEEKEIKETKEEIKYTCLTFEDFWDLYDKKVGKPNTIKLYEKTTEAERELIKEYILKYKLSKPEVKYRKDPERFLKNRVWEDEIISDKQIVIEKTEKDIFSLTFKELKDELLLNYTIPRDDLFYASYEMLIENYKSGKYPKK